MRFSPPGKQVYLFSYDARLGHETRSPDGLDYYLYEGVDYYYTLFAEDDNTFCIEAHFVDTTSPDSSRVSFDYEPEIPSAVGCMG